MIELPRTFGERIDVSPVLDAIGELNGLVERKLYVQLRKGRKFVGDLSTSFYAQFGISQRRLGNIHRVLKAKLKSVTETAKNDAKTFGEMIVAKIKQIRAREKALAKAEDVVAEELQLLRWERLEVEKVGRKKVAKPDPERIANASKERDACRKVLHQHKRRLAVLERKKAKAEAVAAMPVPPICFGSKKLFNAQHHLEENGYADRNEWREDLYERRNGQFFFEGEASRSSGNGFVKLTANAKGSFDVEVRLPEALKHLAETSWKASMGEVHGVHFRKLKFKHGAGELRKALQENRPISWRFLRDGSTWRVFATVVEKIAIPYVEKRYAAGCLAADFNADQVTVVRVDRHGNILQTWLFPLVSVGRTSEQRLDAVRKVAARIARLAADLGLPLVAEDLDFSKKKAQLGASKGARYARMLSSLAYSSFGTALDSACARSGVHLKRVDPAFTSVIGHLKFARRYGLSVHGAAAFSIARRAMELSERLPDPIVLTHEDGGHVTLPRPEWKRKVQTAPTDDAGIVERPKTSIVVEGLRRRHVWSAWGKAARERRAALAEHFRARSARSAAARSEASASGPGAEGHSSRISAGGNPAAKWGPSGPPRQEASACLLLNVRERVVSTRQSG